jgi:hypothetical protein
MAIQSTSAKFAGKMNFRRVLAYCGLILSNIDLEFLADSFAAIAGRQGHRYGADHQQERPSATLVGSI